MIEVIENSFIENITTESENLAQYENLVSQTVQNLLDNVAISKGYDNIMSVRSYAGYPNEFQAEALLLAQWNSLCWVRVASIKNDVIAGKIPMPSVEEVLNLLPKAP